MIPRFGAPPERGRRYIRRVGAYALLPRDGAMLLTVQAEPGPDIQLPGGGIDPGESAFAALHREVFEETGWTIGRPRRVFAYRRFVYMPEYDMWAEKICLIHVARPIARLGPPSEAGHTAIWSDPDAAAQIIGNSADRRVAQMFLQGRFGTAV